MPWCEGGYTSKKWNDNVITMSKKWNDNVIIMSKKWNDYVIIMSLWWVKEEVESAETALNLLGGRPLGVKQGEPTLHSQIT